MAAAIIINGALSTTAFLSPTHRIQHNHHNPIAFTTPNKYTPTPSSPTIKTSLQSTTEPP
eukprot:CAMPEP_0198252910 /NCGR_PEP_ID=MMETSP1447-20131203/3372_1 /TAXON_ID=420782 /ORGANISM="Chaetoceros dichaeta, Strain CCMP1751" /LENGTH=59 /DNA_ID=CAMNT_0043938337 /DNA_START=157 /DNA_END=332 /DNA_ORIENTATION=+